MGNTAMKSFSGACLFALALLAPSNAAANGSIIELEASRVFVSVIHVGDSAHCSETCADRGAEADLNEVPPVSVDKIALEAMPHPVSVDAIALAAMPHADVEPPVALDETTASTTPDVDDGPKILKLFADEDLRLGNQDMTP